MGLLQKIRSKSDKEKNIISLVSAGVITLIIIILWLGFGASKEIKKDESDSKLSEISPFETFKEQFSEITGSFKDNLNKAVQEIDKLGQSTSTEIIQSTTISTSTDNQVNQVNNN